MGDRVEVVDREHAADADAGDSRAEDRETVIAVSGTMGGITGLVALFVVAGTFSLVMAQRRREIAALRALGATPRQIRRLVAGEALIVSVVAGALGLAAGRRWPTPSSACSRATTSCRRASARRLVDPAGRGIRAGRRHLAARRVRGRAPGRAHRARPRRCARPRSSTRGRASSRCWPACSLLGGGVAMSLVFSGFWAQAFAVLGGMLLAAGAGMLGRLCSAGPAALLSWPLRALGAPGMLASANLGANRWRTAALATPVVLIAMLAGTQGVVQSSDQRHTEGVTAARVTADHVVTGRDGAPVRDGSAAAVAALPGVDGVTEVLPTEVFGLDHGLGEESPWTGGRRRTVGTGRALDLDVLAATCATCAATRVAVSRVLAHDGKLAIGDTIRVRLADTAPATLRVAAVYDRAAGLGDVVLDPARRPGAHARWRRRRRCSWPAAAGSLERHAARHPELRAATRAEYLGALEIEDTHGAWGVWLIIGVAAVFAMLSLVNTAAMATGERRQEMATIRLLGGTRGHVARMAALEMLPTLAVGVIAGAVVVAVAVAGVPRGVTGVPLDVPATLIGGLLAGTAVLGLLAGVVTSRLALRASPAEAMRVRD